MCLILFAFRWHPGYRLILAANRDEYYNRATAPAAWWDDHPYLLAGKDLDAGGTWLGITKNGKIAALTNSRGMQQMPDAPSRGLLVSRFLTSHLSIDKYAEELRLTGSRYNAFNLIFGDTRVDNGNLFYFSNVKARPTEGFSSHPPVFKEKKQKQDFLPMAEGFSGSFFEKKGDIERLKPGLYGLSNDTLDSPWPKVLKGKQWLEQHLLNRQDIPVDIERIFSMLADDTIAPDDQLPDTGIGLEKERALSPLFIKTPVYGTRSSTVLSVDNDHQVTFAERTFVPKADAVEKRYRFKIAG